MPFVRSIGRWAMTALVINCIIGSGIFGVPTELIRLVGRASPIAMVVAGVEQATIMASMAKVASQFSEPAGPYLYVRTAFGRFAGIQVAWFSMLAPSVEQRRTQISSSFRSDWCRNRTCSRLVLTTVNGA
jgi:amino acid transporter